MMDAILSGIISTVIGSAIVYILYKVIDSFHTDNSVKLGSINTRITRVQSTADSNLAETKTLSKKTTELELHLKLLKTNFNNLNQAFTELKNDYKEDKKLRSHGQIIQKG